MFERLIIRNFQCHEKQELELDGHITTICGATEAGKSAILRALRWLCTNRPSGQSFIRRGRNKCSVRLLVDNGCELVRVRSKKRNAYVLPDGTTLVALGQGGIPDEVSSLLNLSPVSFQGQHDSPFWLSLSPGQVSKELNAIVNLSLIDKALAEVGQQLRRAKSAVDVSRDRLRQARERRRQLSWVKEANAELEQITVQESTVRELRQNASRIAGFLQEASSVQDAHRNAVRAKPAAANALRVAGELLRLQETCGRLEQLVNKYTLLKKQLRQAAVAAEQAESELYKKLGNRCPVCGGKLAENFEKSIDSRLRTD